jgi:Cys-tRNA(Pro)/Cys-tRNA(Cys) deacylase
MLGSSDTVAALSTPNMTPAINLARKAGIAHQVHEYLHDPANAAYGLEAAEKMGVSPQRVFKTLVVTLDSRNQAVGVVPVSTMLSMKLMAKAAGAKKAVMADRNDVERATGYVLGGVSPLGQKKRLQTIIDSSAENYQTVFVSAGRRGLEIELSPADLKRLVDGEFAELCQS